MRKFLSTILILIAVPLPAFGEWKYSGNAGPYLNALTFSSSEETPTKKAGLMTEMKLEKKFNSTLRFRTDFLLRNDFLARDSVEQFQWIPKNFYVQKKYQSFVFRAGLQTLSIDGPDIINPADVIHAKNWIDPTAPLTMGSPGLSVAQDFNSWNWEVLYIPVQTTPILPGKHSPWLPRENRLPIESENTEMRIPKDVKYKYLPGEEISNAREHNVAFKLQQKSENIESQFIFYDGLNQSPFITIDAQATLVASSPTTILLLESPVGLRPLHYRQQALAGTFLLPFNSWAIKGGVNWLKPKGNDNRLPTESRSGVLGIEKSFETSFGLITFIGQHIRQENLSKNQISFLRSIFERAWSAGVRVPFGEETTLLAGGIYDEIGRSSLSQASLNRRLSNSWSIEGGAKFIQGPKKTLLGLYDRYDSYQLRALYSW